MGKNCWFFLRTRPPTGSLHPAVLCSRCAAVNCGPKGPSRCFTSQNLCLLGWTHSTGPPSERTKARWFCTVPTLPTGNVGHLAHDTPEGREPLFALPSQAAPTSLSPLDSCSAIALLCAMAAPGSREPRHHPAASPLPLTRLGTQVGLWSPVQRLAWLPLGE